jgi:deazaflavin-dependent oxidoreductase (nitroreductase family)
MSDKNLRKFRVVRALERIINPLVFRLRKLGMHSRWATELETIGCKTGQRRHVPVTVRFDHTGAWVICQHGTRSGWGSNIAADPHVRLRQGNQWRHGVAEFKPEDDVVARARQLYGRVSVLNSVYETRPVSVRISFAD